MGLKAQSAYKPSAATFEQMDDDNVITQEGTMDTTTTVDATVSATTAIATAQASSAVAAARAPFKLALAFSDKHGVFDVPTVEGLALAIPRIKGEQGSLFANDDDLGDKIEFEIVSISPRWVVGTGESDAEAGEKCRFSYDNVTTTQGGSLDDYLSSLKAEGYDRAKKTEYLDIFGFVIWSAKKGAIAPEQRELTCLQCSPTSKGNFVAFSTTRGILESKGLAKPLDSVEVHAEKRSKGANKFTNFSWHVPSAK